MKKHNVKLIDGNFTAQNARELLIELLLHKINYHRVQKFSNQIRFGTSMSP